MIPKTDKRKPDSSDIQTILENKNINKLYHFTDRSNLDSIVKYDGLWSWKDCKEKNILIPNTGSDELSKDLDVRKKLEYYVRLSFCKDHPMRHKGKISNPIVLEIDPCVILLNETRFSDINATDNDAHYGNDVNSFKNINFDIMNRDYFSLSSEEKKQYQAEVMVFHHIPLKYILNIDDFGVELSPQIENFDCNEFDIFEGNSIVVTWKTLFAKEVYLNDVKVDKAGRKNLCPLVDENLRLVAKNGAKTCCQKRSLHVYAAPKIVSFYTDKNVLNIDEMGKAALSWSVENSERIEILDNGEVINISFNKTGLFSVAPTHRGTHTYKLIAYSPFVREERKSDSKTISITVEKECLGELSIDKDLVMATLPIHVSWNTSYADCVTLVSNDAEKVEKQGSKVIYLKKTSKVILIVKNELGIKQSEALVRVIPLPKLQQVFLPSPKIDCIINIDVDIQRIQERNRIPKQMLIKDNVILNTLGYERIGAEYVLDKLHSEEYSKQPSVMTKLWRRLTHTSHIKTKQIIKKIWK